MLNGKRISGEKDLAAILDQGKPGEDMTGIFLSPVHPQKTGKDTESFPMQQYRVRLRLQ